MFVNLLSQILGLFLVQQLPVLIARIVVDKDLPITICQEIGSVPTFGSRRGDTQLPVLIPATFIEVVLTRRQQIVILCTLVMYG